MHSAPKNYGVRRLDAAFSGAGLTAPIESSQQVQPRCAKAVSRPPHSISILIPDDTEVVPPFRIRSEDPPMCQRARARSERLKRKDAERSTHARNVRSG